MSRPEDDVVVVESAGPARDHAGRTGVCCYRGLCCHGNMLGTISGSIDRWDMHDDASVASTRVIYSRPPSPLSIFRRCTAQMSNTTPHSLKHISFYRAQGSHGHMSNFYPAPIILDAHVWPTTEHYFQAAKFPVTSHHYAEIRNAASPGEAARMGRQRSRPLRRDWESVKDDVMRWCVLAKYEQHEGLRALLLETKDAVLVEHTHNDRYWADGGDGSGENMLGVVLMETRAMLRQ